MYLANLPTAVRRGTAAYFRRTGFTGIASFFFISMFAIIFFYAAVDNFRFSHLSPADHLSTALTFCGVKPERVETVCAAPEEAKRQLNAIPSNSKEYEQAASLLSAIAQEDEQMAADRQKGLALSQQVAYQRYQANLAGTAHDAFVCAVSTQNQSIISFDDRAHWWTDDGRCYTKLQKERDSEAKKSSYWPTTLRVDTDMDSSWLPDEERICQTYPDEKGKVSVVGCNQIASHRDHNIPVKFWGGLERNTVSNWKCRRESDSFVCRAMD